MNNYTHHFKNILASSSHASFRLGIFHSKMPFHCFWGRKNGLKADKTCKIFSDMNICLHNQIFICLDVAYEHIHLTPGTSYSVMLSTHDYL